VLLLTRLHDGLMMAWVAPSPHQCIDLGGVWRCKTTREDVHIGTSAPYSVLMCTPQTAVVVMPFDVAAARPSDFLTYKKLLCMKSSRNGRTRLLSCPRLTIAFLFRSHDFPTLKGSRLECLGIPL
jgi:hypothetical protein